MGSSLLGSRPSTPDARRPGHGVDRRSALRPCFLVGQQSIVPAPMFWKILPADPASRCVPSRSFHRQWMPPLFGRPAPQCGVLESSTRPLWSRPRSRPSVRRWQHGWADPDSRSFHRP